MDYSTLIAKNRSRFGELEDAVGDPDLFSDPKRAREILREHRRIKETLELWDRLESAKKQLGLHAPSFSNALYLARRS